MWINLICQWVVNLSLQWFLAFHLEMGLAGFWIAKVVMESLIFVSYSTMIGLADWD